MLASVSGFKFYVSFVVACSNGASPDWIIVVVAAVVADAVVVLDAGFR